MGSCSANNCRRPYEIGYKTYRFPRDPVRRAAWAAKVNRLNWAPNDNSRLCEAHFTPDQFRFHPGRECMVLNDDAIPTVFFHNKSKKKRRPPIKRPHEWNKVELDHNYSKSGEEPRPLSVLMVTPSATETTSGTSENIADNFNKDPLDISSWVKRDDEKESEEKFNVNQSSLSLLESSFQIETFNSVELQKNDRL